VIIKKPTIAQNLVDVCVHGSVLATRFSGVV